MKTQPWIAVAVVALCSDAACNYTVGDCHYRGPEDGSGDVGSGIVNSTGPGNPGDNPSGGTLPTSVCNEPDEPSDNSSGNGGSTSGEGPPSGSGSGGSGAGDSGTGGSGAGGSSGTGDIEPVDTWINCKGLNAIDCMIKCGKAGVGCSPAEKHPYKPDVGYGDLYMCKNGWPTSTCSYYYPNGDECVFFKVPLGRFPLCVYIGGKP